MAIDERGAADPVELAVRNVFIAASDGMPSAMAVAAVVDTARRWKTLSPDAQGNSAAADMLQELAGRLRTEAQERGHTAIGKALTEAAQAAALAAIGRR